MGKLGKFVGLPPDERSLLVRTALLLLGVRLALAVAPFGRVERATQRLMAATPGATHKRVPRERLVWAVKAASGPIPGPRCLTQGLVLKVLLERHGYPACLRMGFAKDGGDTFEGHAWVESQGQVVLGGGPSLSRFGR